jgi:hypothetical protein
MDCSQPIKTIGWFGETWGFWIQTGAFILSALAGVAVIYYNAALARTRATIDLIIHQKADKELLAAVEKVYQMHRDKIQFSMYADKHDSEECKCILRVLNNHEFIALGIRQKAFDEKIYKLMQFSNVMKVWNASRGIISEIRQAQQKDTLFQEFEWLARRWNKDPIKKIT